MCTFAPRLSAFTPPNRGAALETSWRTEPDGSEPSLCRPTFSQRPSPTRLTVVSRSLRTTRLLQTPMPRKKQLLTVFRHRPVVKSHPQSHSPLPYFKGSGATHGWGQPQRAQTRDNPVLTPSPSTAPGSFLGLCHQSSLFPYIKRLS